MPVANSYTMKAFQLNIAKVFAIICCASIGIIEVSGTLQSYKASDGREYLIETAYKVIYSLEPQNSKFLLKISNNF